MTGARVSLSFVCIIIFVFAATLPSQAQRVSLRFSPESEKFTTAAKEYQALWDAEGDKIIKAMESVSGLKFPESKIEVVVYEEISRAGVVRSPMKMRASYPADTKKATLIHELGHRHIAQLKRRPADLDEHHVLFLFLYDVWEELYGKRFAEEQVAVEKERKGTYDYESAWEWALALGKEARARRFKEIVRENQCGV